MALTRGTLGLLGRKHPALKHTLKSQSFATSCGDAVRVLHDARVVQALPQEPDLSVTWVLRDSRKGESHEGLIPRHELVFKVC